MLEAQPFGSLKEKLLRGGIAPWRKCGVTWPNWTIHLADLTEAEQAAGTPPEEATQRARTLLGSDDDLADAWLAQPRLKSFTARAPWLVFGLLPPFVAIAVFLVPCLTLVGIAKSQGMLLPHARSPRRMWFQHFAQALALASNLLLGPSLAFLLIALAQRQRLSSKWPLLGIAILALFALHLRVTFPPAMGHRGGAIGVGLFILGGWRNWQAWWAQWPLLDGAKYRPDPGAGRVALLRAIATRAAPGED